MVKKHIMKRICWGPPSAAPFDWGSLFFNKGSLNCVKPLPVTLYFPFTSSQKNSMVKPGMAPDLCSNTERGCLVWKYLPIIELFFIGYYGGRREQGWRQEFSDGGLTLPMRGLKYGFQGTINAKNLRKNRFLPSDGG